MSVLKLKSTSQNNESFVLLLTTESKIIEILTKEDLSQSINISCNNLYKLYYLEIPSSTICSVSFHSQSLPFGSFLLPFFADMKNDSFEREKPEKGEVFLQIEKRPQINEETLQNDITSYYVDEEPLVHFHSENTIFPNTPSHESMLSEAYQAKIENTNLIIDHEKAMRIKAENKIVQMMESFESCLSTVHQRENSLKAKVEKLKEEKLLMIKEINELNAKLEKISQEQGQVCENKLKSFLEIKDENYAEDVEFYKDL